MHMYMCVCMHMWFAHYLLPPTGGRYVFWHHFIRYHLTRTLLYFFLNWQVPYRALRTAPYRAFNNAHAQQPAHTHTAADAKRHTPCPCCRCSCICAYIRIYTMYLCTSTHIYAVAARFADPFAFAHTSICNYPYVYMQSPHALKILLALLSGIALFFGIGFAISAYLRPTAWGQALAARAACRGGCHCSLWRHCSLRSAIPALANMLTPIPHPEPFPLSLTLTPPCVRQPP